jgi:hypothetical protein
MATGLQQGDPCRRTKGLQMTESIYNNAGMPSEQGAGSK